MLHGANCRCTVTYDNWHIFKSQLDNVYTKCGNRYIRKEAIVAYNGTHAPYGKQIFHAQIKTTKNMVFGGMDGNHEVWTLIYPRACRERGVRPSVSNDPHHRFSFFKRMQYDHCFEDALRHCKDGRWNQFHDKPLQYRPSRSLMLVPLFHIGLKREFWPTLLKSPLMQFIPDDYEKIDADVASVGEEVVVDAAPLLHLRHHHHLQVLLQFPRRNLLRQNLLHRKLQRKSPPQKNRKAQRTQTIL